MPDGEREMHPQEREMLRGRQHTVFVANPASEREIEHLRSQVYALGATLEEWRSRAEAAEKQVASVRGYMRRLERAVDARLLRGLGGGTKAQILRDIRVIVGGAGEKEGAGDAVHP